MVTSYLPPMVAAYQLTVTRVSDDEENSGQKRAQWGMDASQPWSPQVLDTAGIQRHSSRETCQGYGILGVLLASASAYQVRI